MDDSQQVDLYSNSLLPRDFFEEMEDEYKRKFKYSELNSFDK